MGLFRKNKEDSPTNPGVNKEGLSAKQLLELAINPEARARTLDAALTGASIDRQKGLSEAVNSRLDGAEDPGYKVQEEFTGSHEDHDPNYVPNKDRYDNERKNINENRKIEEERTPDKVGILIRMSEELNELSLDVGESIEEKQTRMDELGPAIKGLRAATKELSAFDLPIKAIVGKETLASKAAREVALNTLLDVFAIEAQIENGDIKNKEGAKLIIQMCEGNQGAWDQMSLHARTKLQKQLTRAIRPKLATLNLPARMVDSYHRMADAIITPQDTLRDTYEEILRTLESTKTKRGSRIKVDQRAAGETASSNTLLLLEATREKLSKPTIQLVDLARDQVLIIAQHLEALPEGALKAHFDILITEASDNLNNYDEVTSGDNHEEALTLITGISRRLSVISAVGKGDFANADVRLLMKNNTDIGVEIRQLAVNIKEAAHLGMVMGLSNEINLRGIADRVVDVVKKERGLSLKLTWESERTAQYNLTTFSERLQEAATQMETIRGSGADRGVEGLLEGINGLEEMRHLIPVLRQIGEIAMNGNLDTLGITEELIPLPAQQAVVNLCIELDQRGQSLRTESKHQSDYDRETMIDDYEGRLEEIRTLGRESLVAIAIQNIQDTFGIENEDEARKLLTEKGWNEWVNRRNEKKVDQKTLLNLTGRLVSRLRTGVRSNLGIFGGGPVEQWKFKLDDNDPSDISKATFMNDDEISYETSLGRITLLQKGGDMDSNSDTFRNDLALLRSIKFKLGEASIGEKVRNLVLRGEVLNTKSIKRLEQVQTLMEHGTVLAGEALLFISTVLIAKETNQISGDFIGNMMDNAAVHLRAGIDTLDGSIEGAQRNLDSLMRLVDQAKGSFIEIDAVGTPENIQAAETAARNTLIKGASNDAEQAQKTLDQINRQITGHNLRLDAAQGFGKLARDIADIGHAGLAARIAAIGATVEGLRINRNVSVIDKALSKITDKESEPTFLM